MSKGDDEIGCGCKKETLNSKWAEGGGWIKLGSGEVHHRDLMITCTRTDTGMRSKPE